MKSRFKRAVRIRVAHIASGSEAAGKIKTGDEEGVYDDSNDRYSWEARERGRYMSSVVENRTSTNPHSRAFVNARRVNRCKVNLAG